MSNDMKRAFQKAGIKTRGGGIRKKCKSCGKPLKPDSRFDTCYECGMKSKSSSSLALPKDYLEKGYFDEKGCLREGIFKNDAKDVARVLASHNMTSTSFRAFYNKVKAIENSYKISNNFDLIKPKLYAFERDASYQVSRGVVPEEFRKFIIKNSELAQKGPKEFDGFTEHFLSILAYFKDYSK